MKKLILVSAIALFGTINAQQFGVKAGLNIANFNGDVEDTKSLVGFHAGVFSTIAIDEKFSFQPELLYSLQGAKDDSGFSDAKISLSYLNVPLMFKYNIAEKFNVELGPQVGILLSAKGKGGGESVDIKDSFETIDFGLNVGAAYDITPKFSAGLRYNLGLSNIAKDSGDDKVHNGVFQISVGYKFK